MKQHKILISICFLSLLVIHTSCKQKSEQGQGVSQDEPFMIISDSLESWVNSKIPVGVEVMIIKDEKVLYHEAYGFKDHENKIALEKNSIFRIASMTKPITATGILILKDRGLLNLNDKISKYIPDFKPIAADSITIEHLLRHTSGYGEYQIWRDYGEELRVLSGLDEVVDIIAENQPALTLGYEEYSSLNSILLCKIIEKVSGIPAETFLSRNILRPLKMHETYLMENNKAEWFKRIPITYAVKNGNPEVYWTPGTDLSMYPFFRGATGAATTVSDYAKFLQMWLNKGELNGVRILNESTIEEALNNNGKAIGLHWFVPNSPDKKDLFGHGGWYGTIASAYRTDNAIILYFTQTYNNPKISEFFELVAYSGILEHKGPYDIQKELPNLPDQPSTATLKKYVGEYFAITPDSIRWSAIIEEKEGHLEAQIHSVIDSWSERLVNVKPNTFAPGFIKASTPYALAPKVYYQFSESGTFNITVLGEVEFSFVRIEN
ncbi:MAG: serine hydrolase domain-containing protein [Vicingaceae bacterium]|nr:serine hydrolase domain-containing protein [Vicingaceae bacterium]